MAEARRFLSREQCAELLKRTAGFATGGGSTTVFVSDSRWTANLRWARNQVLSSGDVRNNQLRVSRTVRGANGFADTNQTDDTHIERAVRHAERYLAVGHENVESGLQQTYIEDYLKPNIWSEATYTQTAQERAELVRVLVDPAVKAGVLSAGYMQVAAHGWSSMDEARAWYYPFTVAEYSVTVRDPKRGGSGWAGQDQTDWTKLDAKHLAAVALEKCLMSRDPVRMEPGRYTAILEPQAVADFLFHTLKSHDVWDRELAEWGDPTALKESDPYNKYGGGDPRQALSPFGKGNGYSKFGERVMDERLTLTSDPMDPELGYPPFADWTVFRPTTWIKDGVLRTLAYSRSYAVKKLGENSGGVARPDAFRLSGTGPATGVSVEEMIRTTKRGVLVTRFWGIPPGPLNFMAQLYTGYTRDGTWLVENGKIAQPIKNFRFLQSTLAALNAVEQIGIPTRVLSPSDLGGTFPVIVPALKVRDFNFASLTDAV